MTTLTAPAERPELEVEFWSELPAPADALGLPEVLSEGELTNEVEVRVRVCEGEMDEEDETAEEEEIGVLVLVSTTTEGA